MSTYHIPPIDTKKWTQPNIGSMLGSLWATFNVDLSTSMGKVLPSRLTYGFANNTDTDADLKYPVAAIRTKASGTDQWWYVMDAVMFKSTGVDPRTAAQDAIANSPTDLGHLRSDAVEHEGALIVSSATDLHRLASGTWTLSWWHGAGSLNQASMSNVPHPEDVYNRTFMVGDGNFLHTIDRDNTVRYKRLTLPAEFEIRWIRHGADRVWIGTKNLYGRPAEVFEWDGYTETWNRRHVLVGVISFSGVVKDGVPHTITSDGLLMYHNGSTFVEKARLPIFNENFYRDPSTITASWKDQWTEQFLVHWNGMAVIDNMVHVLLSGAIAGVETRLLENMKSGIWCMDDSVGLYHRFGLDASLVAAQKGYASAASIKTGFLTQVERQYGRFVCGATLYRYGSTTTHALFTNDVLGTYNTRGYIITSQLQTANVKDEFEKVWAKIKKLSGSADAIIIKARSGEDINYNYPIRASITWSGTTGTVFTTTSTDFANVVVGDEIEVMLGDGAGALSHVLTITEAGGTYTVTLDETVANFYGSSTVTNATTGQVMVAPWTKLKKADSTSTTPSMIQTALTKTSTWLQMKVGLQTTSGITELEELIVDTQTNIQTNS